ncbi:hypothetical protein MESS4_610039 [Mesorhizobium sp. STM 4661]|nr:hypothetical protein MESS4_610039 [Mesorhizobium sp. STM 4661]
MRGRDFGSDRPFSPLQRRQIDDDILDVGARKDRLAAPAGGEPALLVGNTIVGGHDRVRHEPPHVDDAQPDLAFGEPRADAGEVGRKRPVQMRLGERAAVAERAQAALPIHHQRRAARRIALFAGERLKNRIAGDGIGTYFPAGGRRSNKHRGGEGETNHPFHPNTSPVIVRNQSSA